MLGQLDFGGADVGPPQECCRYRFGERAGDAITRAIELAGLTPADIDHLNAHATGTTFGDRAEARAIRNALGDHNPASMPPRRRWARWAPPERGRPS